MELRQLTARIANAAAHQTGRPWAVVGAVALILAWAATGPLFGFSNTWQLIINSGTSVVTFVMVFLIQNAQNRDTQAIQLKLDELIRVTEGAKNEMIALERESEETLDRVKAELSEACEEIVEDVAEEVTAASRSE